MSLAYLSLLAISVRPMKNEFNKVSSKVSATALYVCLCIVESICHTDV